MPCRAPLRHACSRRAYGPAIPTARGRSPRRSTKPAARGFASGAPSACRFARAGGLPAGRKMDCLYIAGFDSTRDDGEDRVLRFIPRCADRRRPPAGSAARIIASGRRCRSNWIHGGASSRAPSDDLGGRRSSGRVSIYSGRAASASSRRSRDSRGGAAAVDAGHGDAAVAGGSGGWDAAAGRDEGHGRAVAAAARWRAGSAGQGRSRTARASSDDGSWHSRRMGRRRGMDFTIAQRGCPDVTARVTAITACRDGPLRRQRAVRGGGAPGRRACAAKGVGKKC